MRAARYQNELAGVEAEQLAERFYHQALSVSPTIGKKTFKFKHNTTERYDLKYIYICVCFCRCNIFFTHYFYHYTYLCVIKK